MKYIDAEKLKAEIERRIKESNIRQANLEAIHQEGAGVVESPIRAILKSLLSFIDSLQQEQPEVNLEKASRNVYESWMGGTMDDVRRDMVELGKVLNARKEENK